jgi:ribosome-binding protein aMBF1 (putative translation factor)
MKKPAQKRLRKMIPVYAAIARWRKDPKYLAAHAELEKEFSLVAEIVKARAAAGLTQSELAKRMKTTQGAVARLESRASMPSTRTLQRFAAATEHRLKISFERRKRA